jgi:hypothetical protein
MSVTKTEEKYKLGFEPVNVGYWKIGPHFCIYLDKKPNKWVQWWVKYLLNWEWIPI